MCEECIVCMYYDYNNTDCITYKELDERLNTECGSFNVYLKKPYSLKDFSDFRKTVPGFRFKFCPMCGSKIDWKKLYLDWSENVYEKTL